MSNKGDDEKGSLGDSLKKLISVGVGAAFLTEEAIKNMVGDIPLSKDMVSGLLQQAKNSKEDFIKSIREEVVKSLKSVDPKALLHEVLEDYDLEVKAKVKFKKKEQADAKTNGPAESSESGGS
jgi:polyhydroxyalkanoate synthesis regulator phasin